MGSRRSGELYEHLETLFQVGTVGGLSDAQLLERFGASRDAAGEGAFRALVARHGPMVLRVCLSVLQDPHEAEDAFQVTFLALARKAGSIRKQDSIGSWLHGTAVRVAIKARTTAHRRRARESRVMEAAVLSGESQPSIEDRDLSPILHEEVERLPAKYRAPIVLCYLEGMTQDQAAGVLGWPAGTVRGRLARARDLLRSRLTRRGLAVSAGLAASGSSAGGASALVSAALTEATARAAIGRPADAGLSKTAAALLESVLRDTARSRSILLVAPVVLIGLVTVGAAIFVNRARPKLAGERAPTPRLVTIVRPALKDLAGDALPDGALARLGTTRFLAGNLIQEIAYSPDGAILASTDGDLQLWDAATGRLRLAIALSENDGMRMQEMAFAPEGRSMAVGTLNGGIIEYDTADGRTIRRYEMKSQIHTGNAQPRCLVFSSDGAMLAAGFWDAPLTVWDASSGRLIRSFGAESNEVLHLAFTPDGKVLVSSVSMHGAPDFPGQKVTGPSESTVHLWDVGTGRALRRIGVGKAAIGSMALAPDGKTAAVGRVGRVAPPDKQLAAEENDISISLWDLATGRELRRVGRTDACPHRLAFTPDGTALVSGEQSIGFGPVTDVTRTTTLHLWDVATGRELRRWEPRAQGTGCLTIAPDGKTVAWVAFQEHLIRFWDLAAGDQVRPPAGHRGAIGDAAFTPDGKTLVTVSEDRTLRFWDPASGGEIRQIEASDDRVWFAALAGDGKTLATGGAFQPSRLWDVATGRELRRFLIPGEHFAWCGDLSADGKTLVTSDNGAVNFWNTTTGDRRAGKAKLPVLEATIKSLQFAPDGNSVATIGGDWVRFWDVATAGEIRRFALPNKPRRQTGFNLLGARVVHSPDGSILAASSERDGLIFLLDAATGRELDRLDGPESAFKALAFSPDGKILATGIDTGKRAARRELAILLWDVAARRELARVPAHRAYIRGLAFSSDGRRLVSASEDATALVWDVAALTRRSKAGRPPASLGKQEARPGRSAAANIHPEFRFRPIPELNCRALVE
jgi:RNA polymerase sigma factor (sigma-70 family)